MAKGTKYNTYIFFALLVCGTYLRLYNLDNTLLWQDEAETAFYARQVADGKLPNAYDKERGVFLYIGALIPLSSSDAPAGLLDPQMYGFGQEDFDNDGRLIKHPYGDILLTALSFLMFGPSTFSARFLFALTGVFSLILTYKLAAYLYNRRIGLIALAFQTFNIVLIAYERQTRYYSLSLFCFLGVLYFGLKALESNRIKDYLILTLFSMGLILSNPIAAIVSFAVLFVYTSYNQRRVTWVGNKKLIFSLLLLMIFILLYSLIYQPWRSFQITPEHFSYGSKFLKTALFMLRFSADCSFLFVCLGTLILLYRRENSDIFVVLVFLLTLVMYPYFILYSSLYERTLVIIIPLLSIVIARFLDELYLSLQERSLNQTIKRAIFYTVLFIGLIFPGFFSFPFNIIKTMIPEGYSQHLQRDIPAHSNLAYFRKFINGLEPNEFYRRGIINTQWVEEVVEFLEGKNVSSREWIFATFNNTVFLFYSNYRVQLLWPIRKSFIDSYSERFWIIVDPYDSESSASRWFYKFSGSGEHRTNFNYVDKIKTARKYTLPSGAIIYECNYSSN